MIWPVPGAASQEDGWLGVGQFIVHSTTDPSTRAAGSDLAAVASGGSTLAWTGETFRYRPWSAYQAPCTIPTGSRRTATPPTMARKRTRPPMITRRHR